MDITLSSEFLGKYVLEKEVGRGAGGVVYRATQVSLARTVAIKFVDRVPLTHPGGVDRFLNEARILSSLSHPHILKVHDFGIEGAVPYLVVGFAPGETLRHRLLVGQVYGPEETVRVLLQITDALCHVHDRGLIHRDLKPDNVLIGDGGTLLLADFGLVVPTAGPTFELLTGRPPFEGPEEHVVLRKLSESPVPVRAVDPRIPGALGDLVDRLIEREPSRRFPDAAAVLAQLRRIAEVRAGPESAMDRTRPRVPPPETARSAGPRPGAGQRRAAGRGLGRATLVVLTCLAAALVAAVPLLMRSADPQAPRSPGRSGTASPALPARRSPESREALFEALARFGIHQRLATLAKLRSPGQGVGDAAGRAGPGHDVLETCWTEMERAVRELDLERLLNSDWGAGLGRRAGMVSRADLPLYRRLHELVQLSSLLGRVTVGAARTRERSRLIDLFADAVPEAWREVARPSTRNPVAFTVVPRVRLGHRPVGLPEGPYERHSIVDGPETSLLADPEWPTPGALPRIGETGSGKVGYRHPAPVPIGRSDRIADLEVGVGCGSATAGKRTFVVELGTEGGSWTDVALMGRYAAAGDSEEGKACFLRIDPRLVTGQTVFLGVRVEMGPGFGRARRAHVHWLTLRWVARSDRAPTVTGSPGGASKRGGASAPGDR
ncbi:MAG: serine/threonine protein kinase [Candidatus Riflebacteria bacterium]|nr:serine/threonine protein kinase [Candidatus Riflebacteria bacterium]